MQQELQLKTKILKSQSGQRLDQALTYLFSEYSRSQIKKWIINKKIYVDGIIINKPNTKIFGNEDIIIHAITDKELYWLPENIPLNIIYENNDILVINKPNNIVVHPGSGNPNGTILNALLYHYPENIHIPRAGIIHRLDKNTTGLMIIAKNITTQIFLVNALKLKKIVREYDAIVHGCIIKDGIIDEPIKRHPKKRKIMSIHSLGKNAVTHYKVVENFHAYTRLKIRLQTGRTHQIRVHMAHINHSLVGDKTYHNYSKNIKNTSNKLDTKINNFHRQALHAKVLTIINPINNIKMEWYAEIPEDMLILIKLLKLNLSINN